MCECDAGLDGAFDACVLVWGAGSKKRFKKPSMRAGRAVDSDEAANALSLLEDIDMSCLHRSLHVQDMLGDMEVRTKPLTRPVLHGGRGLRAHAPTAAAQPGNP